MGVEADKSHPHHNYARALHPPPGTHPHAGPPAAFTLFGRDLTNKGQEGQASSMQEGQASRK